MIAGYHIHKSKCSIKLGSIYVAGNIRKFNGCGLILHTAMWIIFTQRAPPYGDLHLLFVRESEYFIEFLWNCWFFLIRIIILTFRKIKRFQSLPFLWARLICVLPAYWANDPHSRHFPSYVNSRIENHATSGSQIYCLRKNFLIAC